MASTATDCGWLCRPCPRRFQIILANRLRSRNGRFPYSVLSRPCSGVSRDALLTKEILRLRRHIANGHIRRNLCLGITTDLNRLYFCQLCEIRFFRCKDSVDLLVSFRGKVAQPGPQGVYLVSAIVERGSFVAILLSQIEV
ncbi:hypothetical protein [Mycobacterium malmoense]|uniref:hypothetical protein n=1 Tax=Mycobacterium malmoense TaxID=1780 RepID=UPI001147655C